MAPSLFRMWTCISIESTQLKGSSLLEYSWNQGRGYDTVLDGLDGMEAGHAIRFVRSGTAIQHCFSGGECVGEW